MWATIPWLGVSRHQKYFLQLVAWGKNPSALHLKAGEVSAGMVGLLYLVHCWGL